MPSADLLAAMQRIGEYLAAHQQQGERGEDLIDEKTFDDNRGGWSGQLYASDLVTVMDAAGGPRGIPRSEAARHRAETIASYLSAQTPGVASIANDTVEAAAAKAWEARWQGLTPVQRKAELAAMDAYANDPQHRI